MGQQQLPSLEMLFCVVLRGVVWCVIFIFSCRKSASIDKDSELSEWLPSLLSADALLPVDAALLLNALRPQFLRIPDLDTNAIEKGVLGAVQN